MELVLVGRLLAACVMVGLVLYAVQAFARGVVLRSATATPGGRIVAILETTALPNAASLHVVRVAERYLLVGRSAAQITTLCEIPGEHVAAARAAPLGRSAPAAKNDSDTGTGFGSVGGTGSGTVRRLFAAWRLGRPNRPPL